MKRMPKQRAGTYHDALTTLKSEFRTKFITSYPLTTEMCLCLAFTTRILGLYDKA